MKANASFVDDEPLPVVIVFDTFRVVNVFERAVSDADDDLQLIVVAVNMDLNQHCLTQAEVVQSPMELSSVMRQRAIELDRSQFHLPNPLKYC